MAKRRCFFTFCLPRFSYWYYQCFFHLCGNVPLLRHPLYMAIIIPWRFVVSVPSFCFSVVWGAARLSLPASILCIPLHGLVVEVIVQYTFQDVHLSFLMVAAYSAFEARYCSFRWPRGSLLPFVRWYFRRCVLPFFLRFVRFCVHQGIDLCDVAFVCCVPYSEGGPAGCF